MILGSHCAAPFRRPLVGFRSTFGHGVEVIRRSTDERWCYARRVRIPWWSHQVALRAELSSAHPRSVAGTAAAAQCARSAQRLEGWRRLRAYRVVRRLPSVPVMSTHDWTEVATIPATHADQQIGAAGVTTPHTEVVVTEGHVYVNTLGPEGDADTRHTAGEAREVARALMAAADALEAAQ